ncbi:hypothetical protein FPZ43_09255 [Mucilaginibacter pallidiroseus]|uniref:Uncharacterized protein n=1 Tax=Mucilaginibacter pallidiroseus TaxID=2599295 RepID=A0A563UFH4_9SPHI|nr:hypothetical protein [Mucilaginibacter pallidiroseus]TWR30023.1 hypothetical protein FPZ43_09255 [Mucilaginibacter pallidiroseus]
MKKLSVFVICAVLCSCASVQSIIKSSFPYTATFAIPASSSTGNSQTTVSMGSSFDQNFSKSGNNADRVKDVHIASARLQATDPRDFNIGNLQSAKVYMARANGQGEVMVASRTDIGANVGSSLVLDIDNSVLLDELVREKSVRVKMVYVLRNKTEVKASLKVSLGISASANTAKSGAAAEGTK